jgi:general secretion pathway protein A
MFIEQYKLERNPFAEDSVRPLFASQSMRRSALGLNKLVEGAIQCHFISGVAGVGKTTLLTQQVRQIKDVEVSWISPDVATASMLFQKLMHDIGPGYVEGNTVELRKILEVYLAHQRSQGRLSIVIVDGLERQSAEVMTELEGLCEARTKSLPIANFVLLTRNDELAEEKVAQHRNDPFARVVHTRLAGFTLEETIGYVRSCLQGAGCDWANELIPDAIVRDVQAYTQGIVGDVNALCCAALEKLAADLDDETVRPTVSAKLLKKVAAKLNFRHEPIEVASESDEKLSGKAVSINDNWSLEVEAARLLISSDGKQLAEVSLNRPRMVLGRDGSCDISLDSNYLSRYQNLFLETSNGWMLIDLNSTNGCFVNGRRIRQHRLQDGDLIAVGHHQLRFSIPKHISELCDDETAARKEDTAATDMRAELENWTL